MKPFASQLLTIKRELQMQNTIFDKKIQISDEILKKKEEQLNKQIDKIQEYGNYFKKNYNNKSLKKDFIGLTESEKNRFESANYIEEFIANYDIKKIEIIQKSDQLIFKFPTSELFIKNLGKIADTASSFYLNKNKFRCYKGEDTGLHYMVKAFSTYLEIEVLKQKINFQCENEIKNFEDLFLNTDKGSL